MQALPPPSTTAPGGGQGTGAPGPSISLWAAPDETSRADVRLFDRALKGRWPMSEAIRARVIEQLALIATDRSGMIDTRAQVAAGKALIDADKVNLEDEAAQAVAPKVIETTGGPRLDFSAMTDDELERFVEAGGAV